MENGYIFLHRKFKRWEWYKNINVKTLFIHCLLKVNWEDKKWQGINIKRGTFITSIKSLSDETGLSERQVRTALDKLKLTNELTIKTTSRYSIVTVLKYNDYQTVDKQDDKPLTSKRQTDDKQMTTTNKDNTLKELKKVTKRFVPPTLEMVINYCKERNNKVNAEKFINYYESNGWKVGKNKMKSWQAAIRTWENNNKDKYGKEQSPDVEMPWLEGYINKL